ncbi:MAG: hypothetical protein J5864_00140, partial [Oscillospiraceae bacterium]|nr:hypothetical protein [Oscillospiraceae bacterium]
RIFIVLFFEAFFSGENPSSPSGGESALPLGENHFPPSLGRGQGVGIPRHINLIMRLVYEKNTVFYHLYIKQGPK